MSEMNSNGRPAAGTVMGAIGMIAGILALAVSLGGIADASGHHRHHILIRRGEIAPGAVTGRAIASGSVHASDLAKGAVKKRALASGAVTASALANDSVTSAALAPGSVYGGALGTETIHVTPIADLDQVAANPQWTASNTELAMCGQGEALLGTGFAYTEFGNREVSWLQVSPFLGSTGDGVAGAITTNSGGTAKAQVMALCLQ